MKQRSQAIYLHDHNLGLNLTEAEMSNGMPQIDEMLSTLRNGRWHDIREICQKTRLNAVKFELLTSFLLEYHFIELDRKACKTRLTKPLLQFLRKIEETEKEDNELLPRRHLKVSLA